MKKTKKVISKPKNHVFLAMSKRAGGAGAHIKSDKTLRQQEKIKLRKTIFN